MRAPAHRRATGEFARRFSGKLRVFRAVHEIHGADKSQCLRSAQARIRTFTKFQQGSNGPRCVVRLIHSTREIVRFDRSSGLIFEMPDQRVRPLQPVLLRFGGSGVQQVVEIKVRRPGRESLARHLAQIQKEFVFLLRCSWNYHHREERPCAGCDAVEDSPHTGAENTFFHELVGDGNRSTRRDSASPESTRPRAAVPMALCSTSCRRRAFHRAPFPSLARTDVHNAMSAARPRNEPSRARIRSLRSTSNAPDVPSNNRASRRRRLRCVLPALERAGQSQPSPRRT